MHDLRDKLHKLSVALCIHRAVSMPREGYGDAIVMLATSWKQSPVDSVVYSASIRATEARDKSTPKWVSMRNAPRQRLPMTVGVSGLDGERPRC